MIVLKNRNSKATITPFFTFVKFLEIIQKMHRKVRHNKNKDRVKRVIKLVTDFKSDNLSSTFDFL